MSTHTGTIGPAAADAVSAPLDLLLTDAAFGALRRVNPGGFDLRLAAALATQPGLVDGRGRQVLGKLGRITVGNAEVLPSRPDRRFTKPGWTDNPLLRRVVQAPLAAAHIYRGGHLELTADATGMAPMGRGSSPPKGAEGDTGRECLRSARRRTHVGAAQPAARAYRRAAESCSQAE
jgi:hypothetical protein